MTSAAATRYAGVGELAIALMRRQREADYVVASRGWLAAALLRCRAAIVQRVVPPRCAGEIPDPDASVVNACSGWQHGCRAARSCARPELVEEFRDQWSVDRPAVGSAGVLRDDRECDVAVVAH